MHHNTTMFWDSGNRFSYHLQLLGDSFYYNVLGGARMGVVSDCVGKGRRVRRGGVPRFYIFCI